MFDMGKSYVSNNSGVKNQRKMRCRDGSHSLIKSLCFPVEKHLREVSLTLLQIGFGERIFASANSENPFHATEAAQHVEAADTHTSLSVTADESSLPSTMGDQTEFLSPTTIPSCMPPVTADAFIFRAVTLSPLDDDNHNFSETQEDEDQVSASSQRTLIERPVKQSKKDQDMYDWSLVKSRGKRGRGRG
ncbi:hypothetical protein F2Q69_00034182 [Brassica cretica]|uniref:Uncharacterized protein n=1 Tax=Brassica cretica TaxID=69181 RepID=A0A8S9SFW0_BRACR|nr:hypothetical protein F2Q69_00034182 [Brassica cretica]